jgi:hypothetical protein
MHKQRNADIDRLCVTVPGTINDKVFVAYRSPRSARRENDNSLHDKRNPLGCVKRQK